MIAKEHRKNFKKNTDQYVARVEALASAKEEEVMAV